MIAQPAVIDRKIEGLASVRLLSSDNLNEHQTIVWLPDATYEEIARQAGSPVSVSQALLRDTKFLPTSNTTNSKRGYRNDDNDNATGTETPRDSGRCPEQIVRACEHPRGTGTT